MKYLSLILLAISSFGCNPYSPKVKKAIGYAENNKDELIYVIEHYEKTAEPQKLKAVFHLFANMTNGKHLKGPYYDSLRSFYKQLNTNAKYLKERGNDHGYPILKHLTDSLHHISGPLINQLKVSYDLKNINRSYLIENIDLAFDAWKKAKWKKNIPFNTFLEFILPYKVSFESPNDWRKTILSKYPDLQRRINEIDNMDSAFYYLNKKIESQFHIRYPFELDYMSFDKTFNHYDIVRMGDCSDATNYTTYFMRTFGVPCATDYLLNWGNTHARHSWIKLIHPTVDKTRTAIITNDNNRIDTNNIIDASFFDCPINTSNEKINIQFKRTVPKVYRKMFTYQDDITYLNETFPNEIHPNFRDYTMKDVTNEYLNYGNATINLKKSDWSFNLVYLCVFSPNGWVPVDVALANSTQVSFDKIGKNVMYLPMRYSNKRLTPVGSPFSLTAENRKKEIHLDKRKTNTIFLKRKYPLFSRIAWYANSMNKSLFSVSKTKNFSDSLNIYTVEHASVIPTFVDVNIPVGYNYLKFTPGDGYRVAFAELEFFYEENGILNKLDRKEYELYGPFSDAIENLFDNKFGTIVNSPPFTVKFLNPSKKVTKIRYCPRSDTNFIEPRDYYELFYWDNKWVSLGKKKAEDFSITFKNTPEGALFWLRNLTKGKEERIFTYKNDKQVWW